MKILYVITGLGLGGAEKVVTELADQMILKGHDVKIAYLKGEAIVKPQSSQIELIYLGLESGKKFFTASTAYKKLINEYQPDVVHAHMIHANIFSRLYRFGNKSYKLICTAHSSNEGGAIRMLAYRFTNFLSDVNTNVSKEATNAFIKKRAFSNKNLITVYNGIDLKKFSNANVKKTNPEINFLSVGRFTDAKDYPNLLNAIAMVVKEYPNVHFNIAGDGELRPEIENLIQSLNIEAYVTLLGRRNDIPELMGKADFFILTSKYEGFGLVVAEAMACQTFVIATDSGGVKEVMGDTGILIPPQNTQALANAIIAAINLSSDHYLLNTEKALAHVMQNFDLTSIAEQWERIYEN